MFNLFPIGPWIIWSVTLIKKLILVVASLLPIAATAENTIAIADWRGALFQTRLAAEVNAALQQRTERERLQLQELEQRIRERRQALERDALIMTEAEQQQMLNIVRNEQNNYMSLLQRLEQMRLEEENLFFQRHQGIVESSLRELAVRHDVSVILDVQAVIFADKALNLTDELLVLLNQKLNPVAPGPDSSSNLESNSTEIVSQPETNSSGD